MLEHEPLTTLLRLLHIGTHPLKETFSVLEPIKARKSVKAHNNELIFGVGNGVRGCMEHAGCVAFYIITSLIVTVSRYKLRDTHLMILNRYVFISNFI